MGLKGLRLVLGGQCVEEDFTACMRTIMETDPVAVAWLEEDAQCIEVPATASDFADDSAIHVALKCHEN